MFKNNKFKKILAFSIILSEIFLCGNNVYSSVKRPSSPLNTPTSSPKFKRVSSFSLPKSGGKKVPYVNVLQCEFFTDVEGNLVKIGGSKGGTGKGKLPSLMETLEEAFSLMEID